MKYFRIDPDEFYRTVTTVKDARELIWKIKFGGKEFLCPKCSGDQFIKKPEIRTCRDCSHIVRLRAGTIFEHSKISILLWVRAVFHCMQGTRGISALELQRILKMKSYRTTWTMLHKIREALRQRDLKYKLNKYIELDGASFGKRETGNQVEVLVAIETKDWIDSKGRPKSKAGFAKVMIGAETKQNAQNFVNKNIAEGSMVNTDGSPSLINLRASTSITELLEPIKKSSITGSHGFISSSVTPRFGCLGLITGSIKDFSGNIWLSIPTALTGGTIQILYFLEQWSHAFKQIRLDQERF